MHCKSSRFRGHSLEEASRPLQIVCYPPWQYCWFHTECGGGAFVVDKAEHQKASSRLWDKRGKKRDDWNLMQGQANSRCHNRGRAFVAIAGLLAELHLIQLEITSLILSWQQEMLYASWRHFHTLNTWVRSSPFTCINPNIFNLLKALWHPVSTGEDNWVVLIILAHFSC